MAVSARLTKLMAQRMTKSGVKNADELAALQRASDTQRTTKLENDALLEYMDNQGLADAQNIPPLRKVEAEVEAARVAEEEAARVAMVAPANRKVSFDHQANTPEEFTGRLEQFRDPKFSHEASIQGRWDNMENPDDRALAIAGRYDRWSQQNKPVADQMFHGNTREAIEAREFTDGTAYNATFLDPKASKNDPLIFWHSDIRRDPRGEQLGLIQFDDAANETGLHLGSHQAASDVKGSGGVKVRDEKLLENMKGIFDELEEIAGPGVSGMYDEAFEELRTNMFLRLDERPFPVPTFDELGGVIDEFFENIQHLAQSRLDGDSLNRMKGLISSPDADVMKSRLRSMMRTVADPTMVPFVTNLRKGYYVPDLGRNTSLSFLIHARGKGTFSDEAIDAAINTKNNAGQNQEFHKMLEEKGYDHIIMHNSGEDKGVPSIIVWNSDHLKPLYGPGATNVNGSGTKAAMGMVLAPLAALLGLDNAETGSNK